MLPTEYFRRELLSGCRGVCLGLSVLFFNFGPPGLYIFDCSIQVTTPHQVDFGVGHKDKRFLGKEKAPFNGCVGLPYSVLGAVLSVFSLSYCDLRRKSRTMPISFCSMPIICQPLCLGKIALIPPDNPLRYNPKELSLEHQLHPGAAGSRCES